MSKAKDQQASPGWNPTTKSIVGLTLAGILVVLVIYFRAFIGPLILVFVLSYLLHPLAGFLSQHTRLSWRASVNIIFMVLVILLAGFLSATGVAIYQQMESLIGVIQRFISNDLPTLLENLTDQTFLIGPFVVDFSQFNIESIVQQLLNNLQAMIGQAGGLLGTVATGAAGGLAWTFLVLIVSYFILADIGQVPDMSQIMDVPGYEYDIGRFSRELGRIWNAYLRGQLVVIFFVVLTSFTLLSILGVRYALGIALLTGLARFVPYLGSLTTNTITFLVAVFQTSNNLGMEPFYFALLATGLGIVIDAIYDNVIVPRLLGKSVGVNPGVVMIGALIAASLIGIVGLLLAAPVLATLALFMRYILRKMFDQNPWKEPEPEEPAVNWPWQRWVERLGVWLNQRRIANNEITTGSSAPDPVEADKKTPGG